MIPDCDAMAALFQAPAATNTCLGVRFLHLQVRPAVQISSNANIAHITEPEKSTCKAL
jgi:hypothetical protein